MKKPTVTHELVVMFYEITNNGKTFQELLREHLSTIKHISLFDKLSIMGAVSRWERKRGALSENYTYHVTYVRPVRMYPWSIAETLIEPLNA